MAKKKRRDKVKFHRYNERREQLVKASGHRHTIDEWKSLCRLFNGRCAACNVTTTLTRDHIVPLSQGGVDHILNLQPLCTCCNAIKGNTTRDYRPAWVVTILTEWLL